MIKNNFWLLENENLLKEELLLKLRFERVGKSSKIVQSKYCKGQVYFCGVCFLILKKEDHYTHYLDNNPYNSCKHTKLKPNIKKCPACYTLNPQICQIIDSLNQCFCQSSICKDSLYCLNCSKKLQKDEAHTCKQTQCNIM